MGKAQEQDKFRCLASPHFPMECKCSACSILQQTKKKNKTATIIRSSSPIKCARAEANTQHHEVKKKMKKKNNKKTGEQTQKHSRKWQNDLLHSHKFNSIIAFRFVRAGRHGASKQAAACRERWRSGIGDVAGAGVRMRFPKPVSDIVCLNNIFVSLGCRRREVRIGYGATLKNGEASWADTVRPAPEWSTGGISNIYFFSSFLLPTIDDTENPVQNPVSFWSQRKNWGWNAILLFFLFLRVLIVWRWIMWMGSSGDNGLSRATKTKRTMMHT